MTTIQKIMSTKIATLSPEMNLGMAIEMFAENQCSEAPVIADGKLVGIVSELELFDVLFDPTLRDSPISDFMTRQVWTIAEEDSLGHAAHMFALYGIRVLPVLRDSKLVGLVSRRDILLSTLRTDMSSCEPATDFIPFLDEPATDGTNQEQFLQDHFV